MDALIEILQDDPSESEATRLLAGIALSLVEKKAQEPAAKAVDFLLARNPEVPELRIVLNSSGAVVPLKQRLRNMSWLNSG